MNFDPLLTYIVKQHSINIILFYLTFYDFYKDCKKKNCWSMFISIEKTWIGNKQKLITLWHHFWGMFYQNRLDSIQFNWNCRFNTISSKKICFIELNFCWLAKWQGFFVFFVSCFLKLGRVLKNVTSFKIV